MFLANLGRVCFLQIKLKKKAQVCGFSTLDQQMQLITCDFCSTSLY